jgi:branched-chain amino acid transport system ATP-binding protein
MSAMLEIGDLHVSYGQVDAVRGVSLKLEHGQIISVIGPNGAGKTTLLAAAMGLLPCKGLLRFEGEDLHGLDVEARVERGLCLVPEKRELFGELAERRAQRADTLSGGERQMLAVGRALMSAPRLLMLDEPSLGLAPLIVRDILTIVRKLREDGVSILLVEQNARAALETSDHGYVLETGEIALSGVSQELASDPRVQATYLGGGTNDDG